VHFDGSDLLLTVGFSRLPFVCISKFEVTHTTLPVLLQYALTVSAIPPSRLPVWFFLATVNLHA